MRILFSVNHPAHVHLFKNTIRAFENKGYKIKIVAKNKEITHQLLNELNLKYERIGQEQGNLIRKGLDLLKTDFQLLKIVKKFKPDILVSTGSPSVAHVGKITRTPSIAFGDTDNAIISAWFVVPFTDTICTPSCFSIDFSRKKHIRYNGYHELAYLHPNRFKPDPSILNELSIKKDEKYIIIRFVSWTASHDIGHSGLSLEIKRKAVKEFSKYAKVFISSEIELPEDLKKYQIKIPPKKMHDALAFASLLYGESATMASECACLGIPAIFHDNDGRSYTDEEEKEYGLVFNYSESLKDQKRSIQKGIELLQTPNLKQEWQKRLKKILDDKIDVTAFMVWFIYNYPASVKIMKENPDYQNKFK
jgi:predicted glycosyltransferase